MNDDINCQKNDDSHDESEISSITVDEKMNRKRNKKEYAKHMNLLFQIIESDTEREHRGGKRQRIFENVHDQDEDIKLESESESEENEEESEENAEKSDESEQNSEDENESESEDEEAESDAEDEDDSEYEEEDESDLPDSSKLIKKMKKKIEKMLGKQDESEDERRYMENKYQHIDCEMTDKPDNQKMEREPPNVMDITFEYETCNELKKMLAKQQLENPTNKIIAKSLEMCHDQIKQLIATSKINNTLAFYDVILQETPKDEMSYYLNHLSNEKQVSLVNELREINKEALFHVPHRISILLSEMPHNYKVIAMKKIYEMSEEGTEEHSKQKIWLDNFMRIPFGVYKNLDISLKDGNDKCNDFMHDAKKTLDECVYGMEEAKLQFMQMLGQWIVNPNSVGSAIGLYGPPGTGKTSIVKEGLSKILCRDFGFIALGGNADGAYLEGHSYTYVGAKWGKIAQVLIDSKSMNPIIFFDELDKVSDTAKGQEIIGILTHLIDTTQNTQFQDKYFSEIDLDLSKCLFVFSYNDESLINPILKDRMYKIKTKGYETKEKIIIARKYMLPKLREQLEFNEKDVVWTDEMLMYIINNMTKGESGVRNLKRCLETIYSKLNLFRLMKLDKENDVFGKHMDARIEFPLTLTKKIVDMFVKEHEAINMTLWSMYV